jgi:hypothetical protein
MNTTKVAGNIPSSNFAAVWNNKMYFITSNYYYVHESDGTAAGTHLIKVDNTNLDVNHYAQFGSDDYFLDYKGELYLQASVGGITTGFELCKLSTATLPLHLLSFSGEVQNGRDELYWVTADETHFATFIVEASTNGSEFKPVKNVMASGSNAGRNRYSFQQTSNNTAGSFYRLKMVDQDGSYTYSKVIRLLRHEASGVKVFYNSTTRSIDITTAGTANLQWQLLSINGALIKQGISSLSHTSIGVPAINGASYLLRYSTGDVAQTKKVLVY